MSRIRVKVMGFDAGNLGFYFDSWNLGAEIAENQLKL
jgi:NAD kinase